MKIDFHPDRPKLETRLKALARSSDSTFKGELFRFINPTYSKADDIISGQGAIHAEGRWNLPGDARLSYTAMATTTALFEVLAHVKYYSLPESKALPRVLVAVKLSATRVLDLRKGEIRKTLRLSERTIRKADWRAENRKGLEAPTQAWGWAFATVGFEAVIVPSAADPEGTNVLVFPENLLPASEWRVLTEVQYPKT